MVAAGDRLRTVDLERVAFHGSLLSAARPHEVHARTAHAALRLVLDGASGSDQAAAKEGLSGIGEGDGAKRTAASDHLFQLPA